MQTIQLDRTAQTARFTHAARTAAAQPGVLQKLSPLFATADRFTGLLLRLALGLVFFPHGAQKVLGWYGGYGFSATMGFMASMGIPTLFAFLAIAAEFAGAIALVLGFFTRAAAFGIAAVMAVAIAMVHGQHGFFMNWSGQQAGEGYEYHLLVLAISVVLMVAGGGKWSVDRVIAQALQKPSAS